MEERASGSLPALQGLKPKFGTRWVMQAQAFMGPSDTGHQSSVSAHGVEKWNGLEREHR